MGRKSAEPPKCHCWIAEQHRVREASTFVLRVLGTLHQVAINAATYLPDKHGCVPGDFESGAQCRNLRRQPARRPRQKDSVAAWAVGSRLGGISARLGSVRAEYPNTARKPPGQQTRAARRAHWRSSVEVGEPSPRNPVKYWRLGCSGHAFTGAARFRHPPHTHTHARTHTHTHTHRHGLNQSAELKRAVFVRNRSPSAASLEMWGVLEVG